MDRTLDVLRKTIEWIDAGRPFAAALILGSLGSTPRKRGVRAAIDSTGAIAGTLGGGALEAEAQRRAVGACRSGRPEIFEVALEGCELRDDAPLCGGKVRVLVDPTAAKDRGAYCAAVEALERREGGALLTSVTSAGEVTVTWSSAAEALGFPEAEGFQPWMGQDEALPVPGEGPLKLIIEPIVPEPLLLIAGGGHIGQALAAEASQLGFDVTVVDDRPEFTAAALYPPGVTTRCGDIAAEVEAFPKGTDTYIVIVTRGHQQDAAALAACIRSPAAYVGMIGSRRKISLMRAELIKSGAATAEEFDRVFAPIGLDVGAETVPEIAVSIAAQLVSVRRKGNAASQGSRMR